MYFLHKLRDLVDNFRLARRNILILGRVYFIIRYEYYREIGLFKRIRQVIIALAIIISIYYLFPPFVGLLYSLSWTGLGIQESPSGYSLPQKTLWDWLNLLFVLLVLALVAYFFRRSETHNSSIRSLDAQRSESLNTYIDSIQFLLLHISENDDDFYRDSSRIATARTVALLRELDPDRKAIVLRFLYEAGLLFGPHRFVDLVRANLSGVTSPVTSVVRT